MRFINPWKVKQHISEDWCCRAEAVTAALKQAAPDQRRVLIAQHAALWAEAKRGLEETSSGKCWYCEAAQERSDNTVDHYRPKSHVAERPSHEGYWWLAFEWRNYRFACTFCNSRRRDDETGVSGGKQDHFPLLDESQRAMYEDHDLEAEAPLLLDPCCASDPGLLWYSDDGGVVPNPIACGDKDTVSYRRAKESIDLYHLNHKGARERRALKANEVRELVISVGRLFAAFQHGDMAAKVGVATALRSLVQMVAEGEPYSAASRAALIALRGASPVVDIVLQVV